MISCTRAFACEQKINDVLYRYFVSINLIITELLYPLFFLYYFFPLSLAYYDDYAAKGGSVRMLRNT